MGTLTVKDGTYKVCCKVSPVLNSVMTRAMNCMGRNPAKERIDSLFPDEKLVNGATKLRLTHSRRSKLTADP